MYVPVLRGCNGNGHEENYDPSTTYALKRNANTSLGRPNQELTSPWSPNKRTYMIRHMQLPFYVPFPSAGFQVPPCRLNFNNMQHVVTRPSGKGELIPSPVRLKYPLGVIERCSLGLRLGTINRGRSEHGSSNLEDIPPPPGWIPGCEHINLFLQFSVYCSAPHLIQR